MTASFEDGLHSRLVIFTNLIGQCPSLGRIPEIATFLAEHACGAEHIMVLTKVGQ
jgi:hypothetical protein